MNQNEISFINLTNNKDFEKLESKLNRFNPFKVLNIERYEIRHSNVLGWLLDPC